ncbi:MAG TPA: hypothetical protein VJU86_17840 [Pyrinomonadaceae bacterium]|nr:hypothetical protein [Pyrinomonadaceae bacterium]
MTKTTLKAFANSSPGFALKPWVVKCSKRSLATLKELLQMLYDCVRRRNSFRVAPSRQSAFTQGCQSPTLGWD